VAATMPLPGVSHQAEVVAHQLLTRPQRTATHGLGGMAGAIGVLLPALNPPRELHHCALAQGAANGTAGQPGVHGGGDRRMTWRHGKERNWAKHSP